MILKLSKIVHFPQFVMILARNPSLLKQFTYMDLEVLITVFQKMIWFIGVWPTVHEILAIRISKKDVDYAEIWWNFSISKTNISKTLSHSIINNNIFWKRVMRCFRCIYGNCFNILRFFLLRSAQNWKKITFFKNLSIIT